MGLMKKLAEKKACGGLTADERRWIERAARPPVDPPVDPLDCLSPYERGEVRDEPDARQTASTDR